jgi:biotin transport system ATP-binding protein
VKAPGSVLIFIACRRWQGYGAPIAEGKTKAAKADKGSAVTGGIELERAGYSVQGRVILTDITLRLQEHRIGVIGPNGSGKSTLLRLLAGLIVPGVGRVRVDGLDPAQDRKAALTRLGILFQNPDHQILFPTVDEELAFGLRQLGHSPAVARARVQAVLGRYGLLSWSGQAVAGLSQGQRQFLCLLAVLAMEPETILLDEPFAALDLPTRLRMTRVLAGLSQRLITISHDPEAVAAADRVIWLEAGRVHADGPAAQVLPAFRAEMARRGASDADADLPV